jgi:hypothetical protein
MWLAMFGNDVVGAGIITWDHNLPLSTMVKSQ